MSVQGMIVDGRGARATRRECAAGCPHPAERCWNFVQSVDTLHHKNGERLYFFPANRLPSGGGNPGVGHDPCDPDAFPIYTKNLCPNFPKSKPSSRGCESES
jgi:hypothetical protein